MPKVQSNSPPLAFVGVDESEQKGIHLANMNSWSDMVHSPVDDGEAGPLQASVDVVAAVAANNSAAVLDVKGRIAVGIAPAVAARRFG